jgi:hypothetical protein
LTYLSPIGGAQRYPSLQIMMIGIALRHPSYAGRMQQKTRREAGLFNLEFP